MDADHVAPGKGAYAHIVQVPPQFQSLPTKENLLGHYDYCLSSRFLGPASDQNAAEAGTDLISFFPQYHQLYPGLVQPGCVRAVLSSLAKVGSDA